MWLQYIKNIVKNNSKPVTKINSCYSLKDRRHSFFY